MSLVILNISWMGWMVSCIPRLLPGIEITGTHWVGDWESSRSRQDAWRICYAYQESNLDFFGCPASSLVTIPTQKKKKKFSPRDVPVFYVRLPLCVGHSWLHSCGWGTRMLVYKILLSRLKETGKPGRNCVPVRTPAQCLNRDCNHAAA